MKAWSSRSLHGTYTWHIHIGWISEHCSLWTANQGSLERDLGHPDTKYYIAFYHNWIYRADWDPLGYLVWIPFATPEGSRKLFIDPMSYLPVPWGLVLLKVLGYPRCLVPFKFVMWFVKKGAQSVRREEFLAWPSKIGPPQVLVRLNDVSTNSTNWPI